MQAALREIEPCSDWEIREILMIYLRVQFGKAFLKGSTNVLTMEFPEDTVPPPLDLARRLCDVFNPAVENGYRKWERDELNSFLLLNVTG